MKGSKVFNSLKEKHLRGESIPMLSDLSMDQQNEILIHHSNGEIRALFKKHSVGIKHKWKKIIMEENTTIDDKKIALNEIVDHVWMLLYMPGFFTEHFGWEPIREEFETLFHETMEEIMNAQFLREFEQEYFKLHLENKIEDERLND